MSDRITALLTRRRATLLVVAVVLCLPPFYLDAFWLRIGLFSMAAAIGAIGLALLSGTAGQLSSATPSSSPSARTATPGWPATRDRACRPPSPCPSRC